MSEGQVSGDQIKLENISYWDFAAVPKSFVQRQGSPKAAGARFSSIRVLSRGATPFPSQKRIELSELIGHPISSHAMAKPWIASTDSGKTIISRYRCQRELRGQNGMTPAR